MRRSPARFLAPIALVAFAFALYSVVQDSQKSPTNSNGSSSAVHRGGNVRSGRNGVSVLIRS